MLATNTQRGAQIVIDNWLDIKAGDKLCIVTSKLHYEEAQILCSFGEQKNATCTIMVVNEEGIHVGVYFDNNPKVFDNFDIIIGATDYSIVTTKAIDRAISKKKKFLSLPLSTSNGVSMLAYDFMTMDTNISRNKAEVLIKYIHDCKNIRVTTALGTDISFNMHRRKPGFFNGCIRDSKGYSSSSIEVYIPIVETKTNGILMLDGSLGYIGKVNDPIRIEYRDGKVFNIQDSPQGRVLKEYFESYQDERIYHAAEFGIGLNSISKCNGNCYIEDESVYGTFHIGMGRNIALGGKHEANGHFDLVTKTPNIYFDNRLIMKEGQILIPEFEAY